jgi:hypothetical protein
MTAVLPCPALLPLPSVPVLFLFFSSFLAILQLVRD